MFVFIVGMCVLVSVAIGSLRHDDKVEHAVFIREINDPCLSSNHQNISHLGNRYVNLRETCEHTDSRIKNAWFYAGVDPIASYPNVPEMCSCGYKFPIWMNGMHKLIIYTDRHNCRLYKLETFTV